MLPTNRTLLGIPLGSKVRINFSNYMVYIIFIIVLLIFGLWHGEKFFSASNIMNITRQTAMISIMAVACTFVIAAGQIDLSIGSIVALSSIVSALVLQSTDNLFLAVGAGLLVGAGIGLFNGFFVAKVRIPAFLVTLGTLSLVKGAAMWTTNTSAVPITNDAFTYLFGLGTIGPIPILFIWTILIMGIGHFALRNLPFGKRVLATGGNITSAKYTGINVDRTTISVFVLSGMAASFAGMLYAGRVQTARYTFGEGDELSVIAAVILGGTSMAGGVGTVIGTVIGSLLMGVINNGLIIGGLSVSQQMMVRGAIIILFVTLNMLAHRGKS
ncbi:ABC transporter permease [Ammoniphilus sp. YIM 78166]|uniref:ABC transporter permease n=1 Tax=Ammoniphilus sp. YIM 78166 TaxID=1644106 RepID=UPI00106F25FF|nr:ABC transporter permease [Ammoniphilus sp. YIM 78166]